jgi:hypothetical protein
MLNERKFVEAQMPVGICPVMYVFDIASTSRSLSVCESEGIVPGNKKTNITFTQEMMTIVVRRQSSLLA